MIKMKANLVQIFGSDVGNFLITHQSADYATNPSISALLKDSSFLNAPSEPHESPRDRRRKLLDRAYRGEILIRVSASVVDDTMPSDRHRSSIQTLWLICNGPASIGHNGRRDPKAAGVNSELWDLRQITNGQAAFGGVAVRPDCLPLTELLLTTIIRQIYCILMGASPFSPAAKDPRGANLDLMEFYVAKVKNLEDMEKKKPAKYAALMKYLNETVLPQYNAPDTAPRTPIRPEDAAFRDAISFLFM